MGEEEKHREEEGRGKGIKVNRRENRVEKEKGNILSVVLFSIHKTVS